MSYFHISDILVKSFRLFFIQITEIFKNVNLEIGVLIHNEYEKSLRVLFKSPVVILLNEKLQT